MEHKIDLHILKKLMYGKNLGYNEILDKSFPSNSFDYHLKKIIGQGYIRKEEDKYNLTPDGMQFMSSIDGISLKDKKKPIVCCFILAYDGEKILVNKRLKQPFLGYVGIPGGKLDMGNGLEEQAKEELLDETGLIGDLELKVISNYVTFEKENIAHHVVAFTYIATNLKGELIDKHREGENFFIKKEELEKYKLYPDIPKLVELCFEKGISELSAKRYVKDGEFIGIDFD